MKSYLSVIPALIMCLFFVIMIYSWVSIRATLQRITPKDVPTTDVATTPKDLPITDVATTPENPPNNEKLYRIVNNEDFSYRAPNGQLVVRKDYRVLLLSTDVTRNQIQNIAENIATGKKEVNALVLYFFWPGTEPTGAFTAAMATYAPNGRWADAQQSAPKTLVIEYGRTVAELTPQYRSDTGLQPESRRRKIYWNSLASHRQGIDSTMGP